MARFFLFIGVVWTCAALACEPTVPIQRHHTLAELRVVKGRVTVQGPGEAARAPYPRERLASGSTVELGPHSLAWMRNDSGTTWLVSGPARVALREEALELLQGRLFVDAAQEKNAVLRAERASLEFAEAKASIEVSDEGTLSVYVLRGLVKASPTASASADAVAAIIGKAGEILTFEEGGKHSLKPAVAWDDWTGGLATADPAAGPAPFGIGTVGARKPGEQGLPRFSLVIQRLDVRVTIDHDHALTEVDQTFVNPSSDTVEGIWSFRTPASAVLQRFGIDRDGELIWGRAKESVAAREGYEQRVYEGSDEEPALLEWAGAGVYRARLYPIAPGATRRVVTRYTEWLSRGGDHGERRVYVYPMAAEGSERSLPRIEELSITVDLSRAGAERVRMGMGGERLGDKVLVKAFDVVPRADLAIELYDQGRFDVLAYRSPHALLSEEAPAAAGSDYAREVSREESDYLAIPLRAPPADPSAGLDLAVVVDTSAATEPSALVVGRRLAASLLAHLGPQDRAALFTGDAVLKPVAAESGRLMVLDSARKRAWLSALAGVQRGGATDLGALLTEAAAVLDPKRQGAVVYIGDGVPSVGELTEKSLGERLARLPASTRVFAAAVGTQPNLSVLESVARGAPVEQVEDAYGAGLASLRILEAASRSLWLGGQVELGPGVERVLPRKLPTIFSDETVMVVGRLTGEPLTELVLHGSGGTVRRRLAVRRLADAGDLRRRWGAARLAELADEGAGRAALVDVARRFGLVTPFTSLYVPTRRELSPLAKTLRSTDQREGGTGTRAKGEEGVFGAESARTNKRYAVQGPLDSPDPDAARKAALREAAEYGMIGLLSTGGGGAPLPDVNSDDPLSARGNMWGDEASAAATTTGQGFGSGHGRLGGSRKAAAPKVRTTEAAPSQPERATVPVPASAKPPDPDVPRKATPVPGHERVRCDAAADLPLSERLVLWRERLATARSVEHALHQFQRAMQSCEANDWRERTVLLVEVVESLRATSDRVALWRALLATSPGAADVVFRLLLQRVRTASDLKQLHEALGIERIQPDLLSSLLAKATSPHERLTLLRGAAQAFPDDTELALLVLEAYEDVGDEAGGRAYARQLRRRVDATAHLRIHIGEYYLRLSRHGSPTARAQDADEARRAFGELVEFAPEDPLARRWLGDLLRAHGFFDEARRQYQTLAELTPGDPAVALLLATAEQGLGKTEEAVRFAEKAAASGSSDGLCPLSTGARAFASAALAWARIDARAFQRADELARLRERAERFALRHAEKRVRVIVTWSHPEIKPTLWFSTPTGMSVATDNMPLLGIAQAFPLATPKRAVELRLHPETARRAARIGATALVTLIEAEGHADERLARLEVKFGDRNGQPRPRVVVRCENGSLEEETP
jgi:tetratricopeptide (TPR) repeat protein